ncbi:MAG: SDR family NAD(P)-dependent oxidoreductase [Sphingobium sp.]
MAKKLDGKVALVTGASRGIGRGIALELAAAGATVYITARSIEARHSLDPKFGQQPSGTANETVAEIERAGGKAIALRCDHAVDEDVRAVIDRIGREQGRLDILVNNAMASEAAGWALGPEAGGKPFWQVPLEAWDMMTTVGLRSHFATTVMAMPLLDQSRGLVVNISSPGGEAYWSSVIYGVEKNAGDRMIRDMAFETGKGGVTFLALWPGFVETERQATVAGWREHFLKRYLIARERVAARSGGPVDKVTIDDMQIESQRFCGMAVAALAADPDVNALTGQIVTSPGVADRYGYTDVDGTIPDGFSFLRPGVWDSLAR